MRKVAHPQSPSPLSGLLACLCQDGLLSKTLALHAQQAAQHHQMSIAHYLVAHQLITSDELVRYCQTKFNLEIIDLTTHTFQSLDLNLNDEFIKRHRVIPLFSEHVFLYLGMTDPTDQNTISALQFHTPLNIQIKLISEDALTEYLKQKLDQSITAPMENNLIPFQTAVHVDDTVIEMVNQLIQDAIDQHASDIHIEPFQTQYRVRLRCDGLLVEMTKIPSELAIRLLSRLKIMADMNIAERRFPQDGHITLPNGFDIRLSTSPTAIGEKMVLRIFHQEQSLAIENLGMSDTQMSIFKQCLQKPQGIVLLTGPTGSGKTVTLYAALNFLKQMQKNICTIEDPVEMNLEGINQVNVNYKIGLDFATALKHFLRQDPDVLMVGEIRDTETATIAFQAAQTGHLVLASLHTNSALQTLSRLKDLQIDIKHYVNTFALIIAQRLVRKKDLCTNGFQGRIGIYELMNFDQRLRDEIVNHLDIAHLKNFLSKQQHRTLYEAGIEKVQMGITTLCEVLRVLDGSLL